MMKKSILIKTTGVMIILALAGCTFTSTVTPDNAEQPNNPTSIDIDNHKQDNSDSSESDLDDSDDKEEEDIEEGLDEETKQRYTQYAKLLNDFLYEKDPNGDYYINGLCSELSYNPSDSIENPLYTFLDVNNDGYDELLVGEGPIMYSDGEVYEDTYINIMLPNDTWMNSFMSCIWLYNYDTHKAIVKDFCGYAIGYFDGEKFITEDYFECNIDHQFDEVETDEMHYIFHYVNDELVETLDDRDDYLGPYMEGFSRIEMQPLNDEAIAAIAQMGE